MKGISKSLFASQARVRSAMADAAQASMDTLGYARGDAAAARGAPDADRVASDGTWRDGRFGGPARADGDATRQPASEGRGRGVGDGYHDAEFARRKLRALRVKRGRLCARPDARSRETRHSEPFANHVARC